MRLDDKTNSSIYLLVATGFEDDFVGCCLQILQIKGTRVMVVGMTPGETVGALGGKISPDFSLDQASKLPLPNLIIFPGGQTCSARMTVDPRVHRLVQAALAQGHSLAFGRGAEGGISPKYQQNISLKAQLLFQQNIESTEFVRSLAQLHRSISPSQALSGIREPHP